MSNVEVIHCHPHAHEGETLTVNYLRHHLPSGTLLVNYHLPDGSGTPAATCAPAYSAWRDGVKPDSRLPTIGFRVVCAAKDR